MMGQKRVSKVKAVQKYFSRRNYAKSFLAGRNYRIVVVNTCLLNKEGKIAHPP